MDVIERYELFTVLSSY
jgi:hypothetical protein